MLGAQAVDFFEDDDFFGDFKYAPSPNPNPTLKDQRNNDDEWGDFLQFNSNASSFSNSQPNPTPDPAQPNSQSALTSPGPGSADRFSKPRGAIPLSIFGAEEEEENDQKPEAPADLEFGGPNGLSSSSLSKCENGLHNGFKLDPGKGFSDLILNLYGPKPNSNPDSKLERDSEPDPADESGDFDDDCWEFKDAVSDFGANDSEFEKEQKNYEFSGFDANEDLFEGGFQVANGGILTENGANYNPTQSNTNIDENGWDLKDAFLKVGIANGFNECKKEQEVSDLFGIKTIAPTFEFEVLKEWKAADGSGAETKVHIRDSEFQVHGNGVLEDHGSNITCINANNNLDVNGGEFEDAFHEAESQPEVVKEESSVAGIAGAEPKVSIFGTEFEVGLGKAAVIEHGPNFTSSNANTSLDMNDWAFEDAFPEAGTANSSSEHKGFEALVVNQLHSDKQESGDTFAFQDGLCSTNTSGPGTVISFNDLISSLYSQAEHTSLVRSAQRPGDNGFSLDHLEPSPEIGNGDDEWDENDWEFKDALSEARTDDFTSGYTVGNVKEVATDLNLEHIKDVYFRLKEQLCVLISHHLDDLKNGKKIAALSGEEKKVVAIDEKIQATYEKLHEENMVSKKVHSEEHPRGFSGFDELLKVIQDSGFQAFDMEYTLSKQIPAAEEDLSSAVALFEHATSVLHIMNLASKDEQSSYISTWFKMVLACAKELQCGATIWKQSIDKNVHLQILSETRGLEYFLSLGEIYRVVEVLRAAATLYKPWILSNYGQSMRIFVHLEECKSAWASGLKEALEIISNSMDLKYRGTSKSLLESIDTVHKLDEVTLRNLDFSEVEPICRLSLLSSQVSPDMTMVLWDGKHYLVKLANLWANRISCDPPELPHIDVHR